MFLATHNLTIIQEAKITMRANNMAAMILAGGRGSRLHELTKKVAKPAVHFGGKYRIYDIGILFL